LISGKDDHEVHPLKEKRDFDLVSDAVPFAHSWRLKVAAAIANAKFYSRSNGVVNHEY
jgi:hypothetical protein